MSDIPKPTTEQEKQQQQEGYYSKAKTMASDGAQWAGQKYNEAYESYVPWLEDKYLQYFTKDNKASYATKGMCLIFVGSRERMIGEEMVEEEEGRACALERRRLLCRDCMLSLKRPTSLEGD